MDAQQFLAEFGHIANSPGGVGRLRELILALAFKGELCPQSQSRVDDLLQDIEQQRIASNVETRKQRLVRQGTNGTQADGPYALPENWRWVSLSTVGRTWGQKKPESDFVYIDVSSIDNKAGTLASTLEVLSSGAAPSRARKIVKNGTIIYSTVRPYLLNIAILDREFDHEPIASTAFAVVHPWAGIEARYIYLYLRSPYFVRYVESVQIGMAYPAISDEKFYSGVVPLPPTEEQALIVAKVDELMALCDQLEKQQQDRRKLQHALRESTLQALSGAESPHELQKSWQRLHVNFGRLFSEPEDVRDFKALVLDLAVSGRLLPVPRASTPASALIENIARARVAWAEEAEEQEKKEAVAMLKKLRTQQITMPSAPLPPHWFWASLLQVSQAVVDCHNKTAPYVNEGIHLVRTTDIRDGRMDLTKTRKISEETYAYWARRMPPKAGDIFFTREAPMGEAAIVPEGERVCLGQRTMLIRLFPVLFSSRYLLYVIQSPGFQARMIEAAIGMTVKHLRVGGVEDLMVPVPPREEQNQIVEIVDRLFELCDHHADRIGNSLRVAANLATTTVAALTGISVDAEEESPLKAPQTELIASLRLGTLPDVKDLAPLATLLARNQREMSARDLWQRFGGEIDAFYAQLKTEVAHGWITEPSVAEVRAKPVETAEA